MVGWDQDLSLQNVTIGNTLLTKTHLSLLLTCNNIMKLRLIIPTLLALEAADGRTVRGARRQGRKRGIVRAMRRCYDAFVGYEECLIDADDCEDLRNDYFDCMYTTEEGDVYLDCSSSSTSTAEKDKEDRSVLSTSSTVTSSSFGTQMFEELCKENSGNVLFSPLSGELVICLMFPE